MHGCLLFCIHHQTFRQGGLITIIAAGFSGSVFLAVPNDDCISRPKWQAGPWL